MENSDFRIGNIVRVSRKYENKTYRGVLVRLDYDIENRAHTDGLFSKHVPKHYVKFDEDVRDEVYRTWLMRGSYLYCSYNGSSPQKCFIKEIEYDEFSQNISSLKVAVDDGRKCMIDCIELTIKPDNIDSILVYYRGYDIVRASREPTVPLRPLPFSL